MPPRHHVVRPQFEFPSVLAGKLRSPFGVVLGSPAAAAELAGALPSSDIVGYQMDLFQAARLRAELEERGRFAEVVTAPDLWDLPDPVQTLVYPVALGGERALKIDMIEQAFHVLRPHGVFVVLSPFEKDSFLPNALKKVFGKVHSPMAGSDQIFWCQRQSERPRRRHEMTFQVRVDDVTSLRFLSRPGTFSYGRFDNGARALVETMEIRLGDRVLDLGCGCGTNGIIAARRSGPSGFTTFVDSNLRALALTRINAEGLGIPAVETIASCTLGELPSRTYDVVLANPPYFGQMTIARLFIERGKRCLKPGGRFYLVTRQVEQTFGLMEEAFGQTEAVERRGYVIFQATTS